MQDESIEDQRKKKETETKVAGRHTVCACAARHHFTANTQHSGNQRGGRKATAANTSTSEGGMRALQNAATPSSALRSRTVFQCTRTTLVSSGLVAVAYTQGRQLPSRDEKHRRPAAAHTLPGLGEKERKRLLVSPRDLYNRGRRVPPSGREWPRPHRS